MTEVLEHLADPREVLAWLCSQREVKWLVVSSPEFENSSYHCQEHAWAWDSEGYSDMITAGGWRIEKKASVAGGFQVVLASPEGVNLP